MYEIIWFFFIYGFLGFCVEVIYHALAKGVLVNRGFLNGAICPIYGVGVVIILTVLTSISENPLFIFTGGLVLCSALEWLTGFALNKIFHQKWWDYSDEPFNLNGYICLKFSIDWGIACVFVVKILHPAVIELVDFLDGILGAILLIVISIVFLVDIVATTKTIVGLKKHLAQIDQVAALVRHASDDLTEKLYDGSLKAASESEKARYEASLFKGEIKTRLENLKSNRLILEKRFNYFERRLGRAFPSLTKGNYSDLIGSLKGKIDAELKSYIDNHQGSNK